MTCGGSFQTSLIGIAMELWETFAATARIWVEQLPQSLRALPDDSMKYLAALMAPAGIALLSRQMLTVIATLYLAFLAAADCYGTS